MKPMKSLLKYIKSSAHLLVLSFILGLGFVICSVFGPFLVGKTIDGIFDNLNDFSKLFATVQPYILTLIALISFATVFNYFFDTITNIIVERIVKKIKDDVFEKLNHVSISYIDTHSHGDLVSRCINDCDNVSTALVGSFKQFYQGIMTIVATICFMFYLNWILALIVLFLTPISFAFSYLVAKNSSKYFKKQVRELGNISGNVLENFNNVEILKSYNYQNDSFETFKKINHDCYKAGQKAQFISSFTNPTTRLINNTTYAIVGICGALLCGFSPASNFIAGALCTIGVISSFLQYANQFAKPFEEMSSVLSEIQQGFESYCRINEVLNNSDDVDEGADIEIKDINEIGFNNVFFSYVKERPLIENFNLKITKGMKVALVGPTGCGKTTMINLLLRFYDPISGSISFDGKDSKGIKKSRIREKFGLVLQDTWIFKGTIFDNIAYAKKDATLQEVERAAKEANAFSFISRLPDKFNTVISDSSGLSQGQKQLITIARVFLVLPEIVILDEATSNIDTRSEIKIGVAFNHLMTGRTSFVIAHRLSTIVNSDLIIVMKDGHIIETGKHQELLDKKGFYSELFNAQFAK